MTNVNTMKISFPVELNSTKSRTNFSRGLTLLCIRTMICIKGQLPQLDIFHTLYVHHAHVTANLNLGYSKYAKVVPMHYFSTIALRTPHAITRA